MSVIPRQERGRRALATNRRKYYNILDEAVPELTGETRDAVADLLWREHMRHIARLPKPRNRR